MYRCTYGFYLCILDTWRESDWEIQQKQEEIL